MEVTSFILGQRRIVCAACGRVWGVWGVSVGQVEFCFERGTVGGECAAGGFVLCVGQLGGECAAVGFVL